MYSYYTKDEQNRDGNVMRMLSASDPRGNTLVAVPIGEIHSLRKRVRYRTAPSSAPGSAWDGLWTGSAFALAKYDLSTLSACTAVNKRIALRRLTR